VAQVSEQQLIVGQHTVGSVTVDAGALRGEGGPLNPRLVVPVSVRMDARPQAGGIAVTQLDAYLSASQEQNPATLLGRPESASLLDGFPVRSFADFSQSQTVTLNFFTGPREIAVLEAMRHAATAGTFTLYLHLAPVVAGLQNFNEVNPAAAPEPGPYPIKLGMYSQMLIFWTCRVMPVQITIETSAWAREVLPGLGYDRVRSVEIALPPPLPGNGPAAGEFDRARQALDERRYADCAASCRGILKLWEQQYGASKTERLAHVVARARGWADTERPRFLDRLWQATTDMANAHHHPEGSSQPLALDPADARLLFMLVIALSEYLGA